MNYKLIPARVACFDSDGDERPVDLMKPPEIINPDDSAYCDRLWVIGNEYGHLCAVYAGNDQEALDEACDREAINGLKLDEETVKEREEEHDGAGVMRIGNASEPFDSIHAWIREVTA